MTVVVAGDVMEDVVATLDRAVAFGSDTPARISRRGGGAGANTAVWLARAGARVRLLGRVGDDAAGAALAAELRGEGVDGVAQVDPGRPTGTCVVLVGADGERTMLPDAGANAGLEAEALPAGATHLHVAGYALLHPGSRPAARALLDAARAAGLSTSVDPSSAAPLAHAGPAAFLEWMGEVDLLVPNRAEAAVLAGDEDPEGAARALCTGAAREVVVTLGPSGALWTDGRRVRRADAPPVAVRDTTGAGDALAAGLLAARARGAGPAEALAAGCALAGRAVTRLGGR